MRGSKIACLETLVMVQYQEHHLGGGGCLIQVAFDHGSGDPRSLVVRPEAELAAGIIHSTFSESVIGLVLAMAAKSGCARRGWLCRIG
jgi:hypothetical protein